MTSLRAIHLVFIGASITLMVLVALWGVAMYASEQGTAGYLAFGAGSAAGAAGLAVYLVAFVRKTRRMGME
jgi:hypothetical protein